MDSQPPQTGPSGSKSGRLTGALSNTSVIVTQSERRHQLVHHDAVMAPTKRMTLDAHLNIIIKTDRSTIMKLHAVQCEYIHTMVNGSQLTV
jgi:hypothetical protein